MDTIVNLRIARKRAKRHLADQEAAQNRLAHGRSKAERVQARSDSERAEKRLDQHALEGKDGAAAKDGIAGKDVIGKDGIGKDLR
jgi:hypothetical protein